MYQMQEVVTFEIQVGVESMRSFSSQEVVDQGSKLSIGERGGPRSQQFAQWI